MYDPFKYNSKPYIQDSNRVSITELIRRLQIELTQRYDMGNAWKSIKTQADANQIKDIFERCAGQFRTLAALTYECNLKVDYVRSNLNNGFTFYFVCNCGRRTLHLYKTTDRNWLLCRACHRLRYKKQLNYKERQAMRLLKHPDLLINYLNSTLQNREIALTAVNYLKEIRNALNSK